MWFLQSTLAVNANDKPAYHHLGQKFRHTEAATPDTLIWTLVILVCVALLALGAFMAFRYWSRRVVDKPDRMLLELCYAHQIRRRDRVLLVRSSRSAQLQHPGILFIDPTAWDAFAGSDDFEQLLSIQKRLF